MRFFDTAPGSATTTHTRTMDDIRRRNKLLVIGIAAQNNEHIGVIAALTNALDSEADIEMLKNTSDPQAVLDILSRN